MQQASQPEYQPQRVISDLERKLRRMTIVVGMIGSDGIVVAADRRMVQPAQNDKQFDEYEGICKIVHLEKHKVAYARAGDFVSKTVGEKISTELDNGSFGAFGFDNIRLLLMDIAASVVKAEADKPPPCHFDAYRDRSLLIAFYGDVPGLQLWKLWISPPHPAADIVKEVSICGAIGNRARFFDHYFEESLPVETLIFFASHIVLTASRIDSLMIRGLDVAIFDSAGFRLLDENQKAPLRERSKKLHTLIGEQLGVGFAGGLRRGLQ